MKVTIIGSGNAFGTDGRAHTCFRIDSGEMCVMVDFGAGSIAAWKTVCPDFEAVDGVVISHLHGDHFGGLPFLLLDCQFVDRRTRPLLFIGPPGLRETLDGALEVFFPGAGSIAWGFPWRVQELTPREAISFGDFDVQSFGVIHSAGEVSTGLRLTNGAGIFAYSGDTAWTDTLFEISADADLFLCECSSGDEPVANHLDWPNLKSKLSGFSAKRIALTHMGQSALARRAEMTDAGLTVAFDGQVFDLRA